MSQGDPQGILILGAQEWVREIAKFLRNREIPVALVDSSWYDITRSRMDGIPAYYGSVFSGRLVDRIQLEGMGRFFAMPSNDEANSLAVLQFSQLFERKELYQLSLLSGSEVPGDLVMQTSHLHGRRLFGSAFNYFKLSSLFSQGYVLKATRLGKEFRIEAYRERYGAEGSFCSKSPRLENWCPSLPTGP